jgi:hypothetical protein
LKGPPTNFGQLVVAVLILIATSALTALAGLLLKLVAPSNQVSGYAVVVAGGACLLLGSLTAWQLSRAVYQLRLRNRVEKFEPLRQNLELQLQLATERLASLEPDREALRRSNAYFQHAHNLIESVLSGRLSFADLDGDTTRRALCDMAERYLKALTDHELTVSIWTEPPVGRVTGQLQQHLPARLGAFVDTRSFELVAAAHHTAQEKEDFSVHVEPSWLNYNLRQERDKRRRHAYSAGDFTLSGLRGSDLEAFARHGYQSVCAASFFREPTVGYFVVLSKEPQTFSQIEEQYVLWLARVLELDEAVRTGQSVSL